LLRKSMAARGMQAMLAAIVLYVGASQAVAASGLADGVYDVAYTIQKPDDDSVSIANDYFEKPARVEVVKGEAAAYIQVNHSDWIVSIQHPAGANGAELPIIDADEAANKRTIRLPIADLNDPVPVKMHVVIDELGYDHEYTVRFVFQADGIPAREAASAGTTEAEPEQKPKPAEANNSSNVPQASTAPDGEAESAQKEPSSSPSATASEQPSEAEEASPVAEEEEAQEPIDPDKLEESELGEALDSDSDDHSESARDVATTGANSLGESQQESASSNSSGDWLTIVLIGVAVVGVASGLGYWRKRKKTNV